MQKVHRQGMGRQIALLRERQGWSQRELARWVGLDQSAVSRIEAGRRRVTAEELQRFADAFRVSADALLPGTPAQLPGAVRALAAFSDSDEPLTVLRLDEAPAPLEVHEDSSSPADQGWSDVLLDEGAFERRARHARDYAAFSDPELASEPPLRFASAGAPAPALAPHSSALSAPGPAESWVRTPRATTNVPPEVLAVVDDWWRLRTDAPGDVPAPSWSLGHSAEGKPERIALTPAPFGQGAPGREALYDRVARFWRGELHIDPDDGPAPDLVPLLEDGFGAQIVVARVAAAGDPGAASAGEEPVAASFSAGGVPFLFVNAARPVVLQRYALAHAFAHLALGHGDVVDRRIGWNRNNPTEAAANDFAEEFLAPVPAVRRWYERRGESRKEPSVGAVLALANAFGISAWAALYRSRAALGLGPKQVAALGKALHADERRLLPRQAFLGGLRDTLSHLTPDEAAAPGAYGGPAVLRVPGPMRAWALAAVEEGRMSVEAAAGALRLEPATLARQLERLGLE